MAKTASSRRIRPRVFIASSGLTHARSLAQRFREELKDSAEVELWWEDAIRPGEWLLKELSEKARSHDFGIFLFTPDGFAEIRRKKVMIGNLNVLFEFGLFWGQLGRRAILIVPQNQTVSIPLDLEGLTQIRYKSGDLAPAVRQIKKHFEQCLKDPSEDQSASVLSSPERRFRAALFRNPPNVRIASVVRKIDIRNHGDAKHVDVIEGMEAASTKVSRLSFEIRSSAGRPDMPIYETMKRPANAPSTIEWKWAEEAQTGPVYKGFTTFEPSLTPGAPVSFKRTYTILNAFSWTQEERRAASDYQSDFERAYFQPQDAVDQFELWVSFPETHFPQSFEIFAFYEDQSGRHVEDLVESARARSGFSRLTSERRAILRVGLPLVTHSYEIRWQLPVSDADLPEFSARTFGYVEEVNRRLLSVIELGGAAYMGLKKHLREVRESLGRLVKDPQPAKSKLDCALFLYDRKKGGLRCAGSLLSGDISHPLMKKLFRPGQGLAGRAFRARSAWAYRNVSGLAPVNLHSCEPVDGEVLQGAVLALPLFLPEEPQRCIGVLTIEDRLAVTILREDIEDHELQENLMNVAGTWYLQVLEEVQRSNTSSYWQTKGSRNSGKVRP